ncbi:DUF2723 domain-containing protein [candidate division WOR-3 bacterium]|nr:DUF2723 domain-containing protein [candidate division WOR-3 bacterium]
MRSVKESVFGASVFLFLFVVFGVTSAPSISWWDSPEYVAAAYCWGVPHPPGSPVYVTLARVFCLFAKSPESVSRSVNFLSVTSAAFAGLFLFLSLVRIFRCGSALKKAFVAIASVCGMLSFSVWDSAVEAEVYSLSTLTVFFLLWLSLKTLKEGMKYFIAGAYVLGVSFSIHPTALVAALPLFVSFMVSKFGLKVKAAALCLSVLFFLAGVSSYAILYFRALEKPVLNESAIQDLKDLADVAARKQYGSANLLARSTAERTGWGFFRAFAYQNASYFNYLSWQFTPFVREGISGVFGIFVNSAFMVFFAVVFMYSLWTKIKSGDKKDMLILLSFIVCLSFVLIFLFNFKFCSSDPDPSHIPKEARARDYFFSAGFALMYAFSLGSLIEMKKALAISISFLCVVTALYNGFSGHANRIGNYMPQNFARNILMSAKDNSIILVHGDNDTFTLWFIQIVGGAKIYDENADTGVIVINKSLLNLKWYMDEISGKIPFKLEKVYGEFLKELDIEKENVEEYCRENPMAVKTKDGRILYPSDVVIRCILAQIYEIDYDIETISLPDSSFAELLEKRGKTSFNFYTTEEIPELKNILVRGGLLLEAFGDTSENRRLLLEYDYRGIIDKTYLEENGRLATLDRPAPSAAFKRDIDNQAMFSFYERAIKSLSSTDSLFTALSPFFTGGVRGNEDESIR